MKKISFILLLTLCSLIGFGQQFRTGNAPMKSVNTKMSKEKQTNNVAKAMLSSNFVATDINGVEHNLQTYLDAGKTVIIDFFGYWCSPCWSLHQAGVLEDFYNTYGPAGTDEAVILMVETTSDCTLSLLQGTGTGQGGATQGNWTLTAGGANQVPIIIDGAADSYNTVFGDVTDGYIPNIVMVCPSGQIKLLDSYSTAAAIYANLATCLDASDLATASIVAPGSASIGENVTFESVVETVSPITGYAWTINGGTPATATTEDVTATFAAVGTYTITLEVTNANGTTTATHQITIADCSEGISVFPHTENFASTTLPTCWTSSSNNTENVPFIDEVADEGDYAYIFTSYDEAANSDYNQYLITPLLTTTNQLQYAFDYAVASGYSEGEDFKVGYSTTTDDVSAFTWGETISAQYGTGFETYTHIFPAGVKYFAINYFSDWQYYLAIDNIVISEVTNPVLSADPTTLSFNGLFGTTFTPATVNVTAALLTDPITVTTAAPFSVSSDNVTYGTTATLPTTGGTLYVKYTPTVAGTDNGTVVLSTTGVTNVTITVTGVASDCGTVNTLPFTEDFEDALSSCWINLDDDGDGYTWNNDFAFDGHNGACLSSASYVNYVGALTPDNWLITPKIQLTTDILFTFWMAAQDSGYPAEKYGVFVSTTGTAPADFTQVFVETMNATGGSTGNAKAQTPWVMKTVDLSAYENQEVYIAWRHFDCTDAFYLNIDDISITASPISIEDNMNNNVNVYPNPSTGLVNISVSEFSNVEVYDITGKMIDSFSINANETHSFTQSAGMYIVKINNEIQKVVIE